MYILSHHHSLIQFVIMFRCYVIRLMSSVMRSKRALFFACQEKTIASSLLTDFLTVLMASSWSSCLILSWTYSILAESYFICFSRSILSWFTVCSPTFLPSPSLSFYFSLLVIKSPIFLLSYCIYCVVVLSLVSTTMVRSLIFFQISSALEMLWFCCRFSFSFSAFAFDSQANFLLISSILSVKILFFCSN